jgi:hypothetical protein
MDLLAGVSLVASLAGQQPLPVFQRGEAASVIEQGPQRGLHVAGGLLPWHSQSRQPATP